MTIIRCPEARLASNDANPEPDFKRYGCCQHKGAAHRGTDNIERERRDYQENGDDVMLHESSWATACWHGGVCFFIS
jgi:hypothetical protein